MGYKNSISALFFPIKIHPTLLKEYFPFYSAGYRLTSWKLRSAERQTLVHGNMCMDPFSEKSDGSSLILLKGP